MGQIRLGVDIGGTFTDIILLLDDGTLYSKKVLSTPKDYSLGIEEGVAALLIEAGIAGGEVTELAHGTTVATNTIIERKGALCALVTTEGFRDVLELGRFRSPRLYDLTYQKPKPLIDRRLRFEVSGRIDSSGAIVKPLDEEGLKTVAAQIRKQGVQSLAICFVNSHINPAHEQRALRILQELLPEMSISASTNLVPQIGEYERTSTTVVNAYIQPVVQHYVTSLTQRLSRLDIRAPLMIMQSSGGVLPGEVAAKNPIFIIESGPAAGALGAQKLGAHTGLDNLIVFDMGGTTAKASIVQSHTLSLAPETEVGGGASLGSRMVKGSGYAVQVPTIDIAEVGAGGGSIATVDLGGVMHVGPRSAGSEPGPVCYNRGGDQPTVTDANLLLGYLNPQALVGGDLQLNYRKAEEVVGKLGAPLGLSTTHAAYGIHLIANANMMRALKAVTSEGGHDPARFSMLAIGGNGAVHAANLADNLNVSKVIVPPVAGLFSALGMLFADVDHQLITAFYVRFDQATAESINAVARPLIEEARRLLISEGYIEESDRQIVLYADVKYVGQTAPLIIPFRGLPVTEDMLDEMKRTYGDMHEATYGYRSDSEPMQFVSLKIAGRGIPKESRVPKRVSRAREHDGVKGSRKAYYGKELGWVETTLVSRKGLDGKTLAGPVIVEEYDTTTVVPPGWSVRLDHWNNVIVEKLVREGA